MNRLAAILACLTLAACSAAPSQETLVVENDVPFTLAPGGAAAVKSTLANVRFVSVTEDSRCPRDTTCVWAGEVKVLFELGDAKPTRVELREGESSALGQDRLILVGVEPQPVSTARITPQDYRVTLKLSKVPNE